MWKHRLELTSPRCLSSDIERKLKVRRDGVWGVEMKLRFIVATWIDHPEEWLDILQRWVLRQKNPDRVWELIEPVMVDWMLDRNVDQNIRHRFTDILNDFDQIKSTCSTSNRNSGVLSS
jgi:hypothetical protein